MENFEVLLLFSFLSGMVLANVAAEIANNKGRSALAFFTAGVIAWPVALVVALLIPPKKAEP